MPDEYQLQPLLGPGIPFRGMNSATSASHLPPGKMADSVNLRSVQGVATVRLPTRARTSAGIPASGNFRGAYECLFDGIPTLFVAVEVSGQVRVLKSTDAGASFAEITGNSSSGPYGVTRLSDNGLVEFQVVRDRPYLSGTAYDCLIIQNNLDAPRLYAHASTYGGASFPFPGYGMVTIVQPDTPQNVSQQVKLKNFFLISDPSQTSYSSATGLSLTDSSSTAGQNWINVQVANSYVAGTSSVVQFSSPLNLSSLRPVYVTGSATAGFWESMKLEVSPNGTNWSVVYDPNIITATPTQPTKVGINPPLGVAETVNQWGVTINPPSAMVTAGAINQIRFTWTGAIPTPSSPITGELYVFGAQGNQSASDSLAVAFSQANGRGIGAATVAPPSPPIWSTLVGGASNRLMELSTNPAFGYDLYLRADNSSLYGGITGVDRALFYRRSLGESDWYLVASALTSIYVSTWGLDNPLGVFYKDTDGAVEDLSRPILDSGFSVVPIGQPMCSTASRFFVGASDRLWYSGTERPFEFRRYILDDGNGSLLGSSPGSLGIDGENLQALLSIGSLSGGNEDVGVPNNGISTVFMLTDRTASWVTGWDATSLNKRNLMYAKGTYMPKSVAASRTGFLFLDTDRHVINVDGFQVSQISRDLIDDRLDGIPNSQIGWGWGAVRNDRYYLTYAPSGQTTNTQALVYDVHESQRNGEPVWLSDTFPSAAGIAGVSALLTYRDGATSRLLGFDSKGHCLEHEAAGQTSDEGTAGVAWAMTFPEVHAGLWQPVKVRRLGIVAESSTGSGAGFGTVTSTRTTMGREVADIATATIDTTSVEGPRVVRWDNTNTGGNAGVASGSVQIRVSGESPSGSRLLSFLAEVGASQAAGPDIA